jgi:hypothetical protein
MDTLPGLRRRGDSGQKTKAVIPVRGSDRRTAGRRAAEMIHGIRVEDKKKLRRFLHKTENARGLHDDQDLMNRAYSVNPVILSKVLILYKDRFSLVD